MEKKRNLNIEILRVVSMFMVIVLHALGHGGVLEYYYLGDSGYFIFWLIEAFCMVAVNCFVLITGYFGWKSKFMISRVFKFYIEIFLFSLVSLILAVINKGGYEVKDVFYCFIPLTSKRYWFASYYFMLMLIQPFLNIFIGKISREIHRNAIIIFFVIFSIVPTILVWNREIAGTGMDLWWFIVLYLTGAYLNKYDCKFTQQKLIICYFLLSVILFGSNVMIAYSTKMLLGNIKGVGTLYNYNSIIVYLASVCLFLFFANKKNNTNGMSSRIALCGKFSFGAYLISDHCIIREILWKKINIIGTTLGNPYLICVYILCISICIFVFGCILDILWKRIISFNKLNTAWTNCDILINNKLKQDKFL